MNTETRRVHTQDEAFQKFKLINGAGDGQETACAMTLLAWMAGRDWTDHPECVHRLIADVVIAANDAVGATTSKRRKLVEAGLDGALDTWWIPDIVIVAGMASPKSAKSQTAQQRAMQLLRFVTQWKKTKEQPNLRNANLCGVDLWGANLWGADLRNANLRNANLRGANLRGADLRNAVLRNANLRGANLWGADLRNANLRGALNDPGTGLR